MLRQFPDNVKQEVEVAFADKVAIADKFYKYGSFRRRSDYRQVQRFKCCGCGITFSTATNEPELGQNKRQVNSHLLHYLSSNVSMRRSAKLLKISRTTVARKLQFLAQECRKDFEDYWQEKGVVTNWQFDELQTIEHSKSKPLSVVMAVEEKSRKIMGFQVTMMPATGHLAKSSRKKYGARPDHRRRGIQQLFSAIQALTSTHAQIRSDQCQPYGALVKRYFPHARHQQFKGEKSRASGQGELKKGGLDPLFWINHTFAMLRANINRLIRKTWCTTKKISCLADHLAIYVYFHNRHLTPN